VERYISMVVIPPIVVIIVFVNAVISIMLTSAYLPAASTFIVLSIYAVLASFMAPYYSLLVGMNKPGTYAKIGLGISLIAIALNFLFIPKWGLLTPVGINGPTGAAVALMLSNLVGFVWIRLAAKKLTGIQLLQIHTLRHIIAGAAMGLVLYVIAFRTTFFPNIHWYHLLMFAGIGLVVYIAVLYLLREFTKNDFNFFIELLHPKKMLQYIKSEVKEEESSEKK